MSGLDAVTVAGLAATVPLGAWAIQQAAALEHASPPPRPPRVPAPLLLAVAGAHASAALVSPPWLALVSAPLAWALLALAWIDARTLLLPNFLTAPLILFGLAVAVMRPDAAALDHIVGAALGFAALAGTAALYQRSRGREGLGLGDAKLAAAGGAWLGWQGAPGMLLIAALAALLTVGALALSGRRVDPDEPVPFGPFLALGFWLVWLFGPIGWSPTTPPVQL